MFGGIKKSLCNKCFKLITVNNLKRHREICGICKPKKIRGVDYDPNVGFKNNTRKQWNDGLSKESDDRLNKYSEIMKSLYRTGQIKPSGCCSKEYHSSNQFKINSAKGGGYRTNSGHSKKFKVSDSFGNIVTLQSTYELDTANILNLLNIKWVRPSYLKYNNKKYFPDFLLVEYNIYLDPKNTYLATKDKEKIDLAAKQNLAHIVVLEKIKLI